MFLFPEKLFSRFRVLNRRFDENLSGGIPRGLPGALPITLADRNLNPHKGILAPHTRYDFVPDPICGVVGMQELRWTSMEWFDLAQSLLTVQLLWLDDASEKTSDQGFRHRSLGGYVITGAPTH